MSVYLKKHTITVILSLLAIAASAQSERHVATDNPLKNFIDSTVHEVAGSYMQDASAVGLSIGFCKDGKQYFYNYGETRKGNNSLPGKNTLYDIGSVAKVFVTTLLAKAVTDKRVSLTDDIRKYLPGKYPNLSYQDHPVRLVDLANHTSGLPELSRNYSESTIDSVMKLDALGLKNFYTIYTADSLLKDMHHFTVDTIPGTKYRYNGNAMEVLLLLLERVYHKPFETVLTNYLQSRFRMYDTKITLTASEEKRLAQGYDENGQPQPYVNFNGYRAAPGMNSTIADMLKLIQANIDETIPAIKLTHQLTFTKSPTSWMGLGWMIEKSADGDRMIYHSGRGSGITTLCTVHPERRIGFIITVNDGGSEKRLFEMEEMLTKEFLKNKKSSASGKERQRLGN